MISKIEIKSEFILVGNLFINMGMVTDCYIDSGILKLSQMGGSYLIIGNNDCPYLDPGQPFAAMLDEPYYVALSAYLKDRFQAKEIKPREERND